MKRYVRASKKSDIVSHIVNLALPTYRERIEGIMNRLRTYDEGKYAAYVDQIGRNILDMVIDRVRNYLTRHIDTSKTVDEVPSYNKKWYDFSISNDPFWKELALSLELERIYENSKSGEIFLYMTSNFGGWTGLCYLILDGDRVCMDKVSTRELQARNVECIVDAMY